MTATATEPVPATFSFGENWSQYVDRQFSAERLRAHRECLLGFLSVADLRGKTLVDIGSGSGMLSLAAHDAGAERVVSFDFDPKSVEATERLRAMRGEPGNWSVSHGSALDPDFIASLGTFDVALSWGVLHHTGRMWDAVRLCSRLVAPGGSYFLALYTTDHASEFWTRQKRRYNAGGRLKKLYMDYSYTFHDLVRPNLLRPGRILHRLRDEAANRGMDYMTTVRDWLGGWPYEHARVEEVLNFCLHELGLQYVNLRTGEACTEYFFTRAV
jgi:2-polyprenyl-6-hydroxyphenyl methylase/3-demethylubiquinone-9 3-methyltransferase